MSPSAVAILRASRRHSNGVRYWAIPGAPNEAKLIPARLSFWKAPAFYWPHFDHPRAKADWVMRGVRLDWHRSIAKTAALDIIQAIAADLGKGA